MHDNRGDFAKDSIYMCIATLPKYAVSETIGRMNDKSAIAVARQFGWKRGMSTEKTFARLRDVNIRI